MALVTERINGLVTGVVMDSRGIYMSKTAQEAEPFAKGMESRFPQLRQQTAALIGSSRRASVSAQGRSARRIEEFISFRSETIRLGREVSTAAANAQGNNDANRANRKALNDLLTAFSQRNEQVGNAARRRSGRLHQPGAMDPAWSCSPRRFWPRSPRRCSSRSARSPGRCSTSAA